MSLRHVLLLALLVFTVVSQETTIRGGEVTPATPVAVPQEAQTNTLSAQTFNYWYKNPFDVDSMAYGATHDKAPLVDFPGVDGSPCKICEVDCMQRTDLFSSCHFRYFRYSCKRKQYCITTENIAPGEYYGAIALCLSFAGCTLHAHNMNPTTLEYQNDLYKFANPYYYCQTYVAWDWWGCVSRLTTRQITIANKFAVNEFNPDTWNPDWWREWLKHRALLAAEDNISGMRSLLAGIMPVQTISNGFYVYFKVVSDFKLNYDKGAFRGGIAVMKRFFNMMNANHLQRIPVQFRAAWKLYPLTEAQKDALIRQITTTGTTRLHQFYETMQGCLDEIEYTASANMHLRYYWLGFNSFYQKMIESRDTCAMKFVNLAKSWVGRYWNPYAEDLVYNIMLA